MPSIAVVEETRSVEVFSLDVVHQWEFLFLGANMDAINVGGGFGIQQANAMTYTPDSLGVNSTLNSVSAYMTRSRTVNDTTGFSEADRVKAQQ